MAVCSKFLQRFTYITGVDKTKNLMTKACLCNQLELWEVTDENNIDHFLMKN